MRIIALTLVLALTGCFVTNHDQDVNGADPCPEDATNDCVVPDDADADTDTDSDSDTDADTDSDTDSAVDTADTGDTGDTGEEPCAEFTWFRDSDGDGFGDADTTTVNCEPSPDGYVADATDCDDEDALSYPGAPEICDGVDNDCDVSIDENVSEIWFVDNDGDGFGSGSGVDVICDGASDTLVDNADDCDDDNVDVSPAATEACNGADDDCDGAVPADETDDDGDGLSECSGNDCDDADATVGPGLPELCNGADDDCDGLVPADETDDDADGFNECADADCDDASSGNYPGAPESCDGADNDCDGTVDESDATDVATWYHDADADGYGDASTGFVSCSAPAGYVSDSSDCDDANGEVNPSAIEVCDEVDNDCEGTVDEAADDATVWWMDADGDSYGDDDYSLHQIACDQPSGMVENDDDCDDSSASVNPDGTEVYDDLVDNDCNGIVDDSGVYCCLDSDGDGYGDAADCVYEETGICSDADYVIGDGDCDDSNASMNPGAYDDVHDLVDANCDGSA